MHVQYNGTDQYWKDETTIHWFSVSGDMNSHNLAVDGEYGWADNNGHISILDADGCPLTDGDGETEVVRHAIAPEIERL